MASLMPNEQTVLFSKILSSFGYISPKLVMDDSDYKIIERAM